MLLIADSGSTKCDWLLLSQERQTSIYTKGLNPFFLTAEEISNVLIHSELGELAGEVTKVFFYGAGCSSDAQRQTVYDGLAKIFVRAAIEVDHDIAASAYAACGNAPGIACILGTGSNACYFDGWSISQSVPSLGYILGDEGSGTQLGKTLWSDFFYKRMPEHLRRAFAANYALTKDEVLTKVYKEEGANVFLASFTPFLVQHRSEAYVHQMLSDAFRCFLEIHVRSIEQHKSCKTHFIGSIAYLFKDELIKVCHEMGIQTGQVIQRPIDGLAAFHRKDL